MRGIQLGAAHCGATAAEARQSARNAPCRALARTKQSYIKGWAVAALLAALLWLLLWRWLLSCLVLRCCVGRAANTLFAAACCSCCSCCSCGCFVLAGGRPWQSATALVRRRRVGSHRAAACCPLA